MMIMAQFTTTEVAEKLNTTPRTLRKFLRADARANGNADSLPGKGSRYALEGKDLPGMKKRFAAWQVVEAEARKARAEKAADEATAALEATTDED
jgi:predicted transcriptional regulator